jgi:galactoside O-acetyltransferase
VHLAVNVLIFGGGGRVTVGPLSNLSSQVRCYTASDDFRGDYLFGPTVPMEFRNVRQGDVSIEPCVLIGSGSLILPGIAIGEGAACGANTVLSRNVIPGAVMLGHPAQQIDSRSVESLRALRRKYLESLGETDRARDPAAW